MEISRRDVLKGSSITAMALFFGAPSLAKQDDFMGFKQVKASVEDRVIVPEGYESKILISWGDPLFAKASPFDRLRNITNDYAKNAALCFGDDTDGMSLFPIDASNDKRGIMAVNNEYVNPELMFNPNNVLSADDVLYMQNSLGVSIFEVKREDDGFYSPVLDSKFNRRLTAHTKFELTGPVRGDDAVKTAADPDGVIVLGTINNCGNGQTPWGTYLTCEENFDDFFGSSDAEFKPTLSQKRYGLAQKSQYGWEKFDERFDVKKNPNEPNRFGWIVEIDPYDPSSTPKKRTAMGRFKHENCEIVISKDGYIVAYSGDDEVDEFVYKFVSKNKFDKNDKIKNRDILEEGTLYAAKFNGAHGDFKGKIRWLELTYGKNGLDASKGFKNQADVLINVRLAASLLGATPMDRCEWIAKDPNSKYLFATFTNNKTRKEGAEDAPNPRAKNVYGQILKFAPINDDHASGEFTWEMFALAGNPSVKSGLYKGSNNITSENMFNSPDGLKFDKLGRLWIQTDGNYKNKGDFEGMGNNQMLCANPMTGEIRRFLTGPVACEITGMAFSDDMRTMLVGVQHPGEELAPSSFPDGGATIPRSSIVMIVKKDGGIIGS